MEDIYVDPEMRAVLIDLAVRNKTITYSRLNADFDTGYNLQDPDDRDGFAEDVQAISFKEVKEGRPPISSIVVYKSGSVGKDMLESLYTMCTELYNLDPETSSPNSKFLKSMQAKCNEFWKDSTNYRKFGPKKW